MSVTIAIVGRPNVGKSTLFNRLVGRREALVAKTPGLTRDRREAETEIAGHGVRLIDTAGLEEADSGSLAARMRQQSEAAVAEADLVLFVIDARAGLVPADEAFAELVRATGTPAILVANKCEGRSGEGGYYDAFSLGFGEPVALSAEHGEGLGELHRLIGDVCERLAGEAGSDVIEADEADETKALRVAIVGRPNTGKSTLTNALLGEERMITGPEAGITRDSIASELLWEDCPLRLFDTAGLRRKARVGDYAEKLSVGDTLRAVRFAEVVILVLDVEMPFEKQDLQIAHQIVEEGRALVIAVNKWDLVENRQAAQRALEQEVERLLPQVRGVPLVPVSALRRQGLARLMTAVFAVHALWNRRVPTAALNQWLAEMVERHPPPAVGGRRLRLRYITQPHARPPTFVLFCSRPSKLPEAYRRYLVNGLREAFDLPGIPLRLGLKKGKNPYA